MPQELPPDQNSDLLEQAAGIIAHAQALLITAGAGMGVDSGLPDFRGPEGFWRAYPAYRRLGLNFARLADPRHFRDDPALAWGFYGHRLHLYRATVPHAGFTILQRWGERMAGGYGVFTSNVDGQFQRAGFDPERITQVHGSIHHLQCLHGCGASVWPADGVQVDVNPETMRARQPLPRCLACGGLARPNILMFGDGDWDGRVSAAQEHHLSEWLWRQSTRGLRLAVVELGAGTAIPTVRLFSEAVVREHGARLVRFNLRDPEVPDGQVGLPLSALAGLQCIDESLAP